MVSRLSSLLILLSLCFMAAPVFAQDGWVIYDNQTSARMPAAFNDPDLSTSDDEEKDYAWGDIDNDGDIDLINVRKQPFTSTGKRVNVLWINEGIAEGHSMNGVLVDRTEEYATASDISGDQGFNTATNDRDVVLVDLDLDGWLDMVTATTLTDNQAKHMSHPRIYMNLGEIAGVWQGFRYEDARIPQMHATAGPRFCSVAAGDLTGDGYPDLYFGDYDSGGSQIFDWNNKLLINNGNGYFSDQSTDRMNSEMLLSAFGAASVIADMNDDGVMDVVKQTSLNPPQHVAITYNNPSNEGFFNAYDIHNTLAPYFVSVGDLNGDGRLDMVVVDDNTDRYYLNTGNGTNGRANFTELTLPSGPSAGFGGDAYIEDLNKDGHNDVVTTDVDVDISGCSRRMHIYRNLGNVPNVTFQEQGEVIPSNMLTGTHDVAIFDLNGDTWLDLVVGRCNSTEIYINQPPFGLVFSYPNGLPGYLTPDEETELVVSLDAIGGGTPDTGSTRLFTNVADGGWVEQSMEPIGGDQFRGFIPAAQCTATVQYYVQGSLVENPVPFTDPGGAPGSFYSAVASLGVDITFYDQIEGDVTEWTIEADPSVETGGWEQVDPNGTIQNGELAAPEDDATAGTENTMCFVTENGPVGGEAGQNDVDFGPVHLISPVVDLSSADATISYSRWFYCNDAGADGADYFTVAISNDSGSTWVGLPDQTTGGTNGWETDSFRVSDYIDPTEFVRVRFTAADVPNDSVTEAAIDNFQVEEVLCGNECPSDIDGDGSTGFQDLLALLSAWGTCPPSDCPADVDDSGAVDFSDLLMVLSGWGDC